MSNKKQPSFFGEISSADKPVDLPKRTGKFVSYTTIECPCISFEDIDLTYAPYPFGIVNNVFEEKFFNKLCDTFPDDSQLSEYLSLGNKLLLSEGSNPEKFFEFLEHSEDWKRLYDIVKSPQFVDYTLQSLNRLGVDLGCEGLPILEVGNHAKSEAGLFGRFEFSSLPAHEGSHRPHTDISKKIISIVVSMTRDKDWKTEYGGGTAMCVAKDLKKSYNQVNLYQEFDDVDVIQTAPFKENVASIIVKTHNSLHAVMPIKAPVDEVVRRRTIVMQIIRNNPNY